MAKRKRRTRSGHPGVKLLERRHASGATSWVARWTDPDTDRPTQTSLDALGLSAREARRAWAVAKSRTLSRRRAELASGAPKRTETPFKEAVASYLQAAGARLRPKTVETYREGLALLVEWASSHRVRLVEDLTPGKLGALREWLAARPRRASAAGEKQGAKKDTPKLRAPRTVNRNLEAIKALVNHWRRLGLTPTLSTDTIRDSLKMLRGPKPLPEVLHTPELDALLRACLRHDAQTFDLTREEKARGLKRGTTPRHPAVTPFALAILLGGFRFEEARTLTWARVRLDASDERGEVVGEVVVGVESKTHAARVVDLAPSPALRRLLAALRLRSGGEPHVFGGPEPWSRNLLEAARKRLVREFGAPPFSWQMLRRSCGSYSVCAPGIYGAAAVFLTAKRLGHAIAVSERHYLGALRGLPREARTLEDAMQVAALVGQSVLRATGELSAADLLHALDEQAKTLGAVG
ncbi:MAG: hypothetical protein AB7N76_32420 [Planctomycetota bacterium]